MLRFAETTGRWRVVLGRPTKGAAHRRAAPGVLRVVGLGAVALGTVCGQCAESPQPWKDWPADVFEEIMPVHTETAAPTDDRGGELPPDVFTTIGPLDPKIMSPAAAARRVLLSLIHEGDIGAWAFHDKGECFDFGRNHFQAAEMFRKAVDLASSASCRRWSLCHLAWAARKTGDLETCASAATHYMSEFGALASTDASLWRQARQVFSLGIGALGELARTAQRDEWIRRATTEIGVEWGVRGLQLRVREVLRPGARPTQVEMQTVRDLLADIEGLGDPGGLMRCREMAAAYLAVGDVERSQEETSRGQAISKRLAESGSTAVAGVKEDVDWLREHGLTLDFLRNHPIWVRSARAALERGGHRSEVLKYQLASAVLRAQGAPGQRVVVGLPLAALRPEHMCSGSCGHTSWTCKYDPVGDKCHMAWFQEEKSCASVWATYQCRYKGGSTTCNTSTGEGCCWVVQAAPRIGDVCFGDGNDDCNTGQTSTWGQCSQHEDCEEEQC